MKVVLWLLGLLALASQQTAINNAPTDSAATAPPLSEQILQNYSAGRYIETVNLLEQYRQTDPESFAALPYELLYAKALMRAGQPDRALHAYRALKSIPKLKRFIILDAARLASDLKLNDEALRYYNDALQDRAMPEYSATAKEALEFAYANKDAEGLKKLADVIGKTPALNRLSQFYLGRAYLLQNNPPSASYAFSKLIMATKQDDITSQSLTELDDLEGSNLKGEQAVSRGKLAYKVWNFDLAKKYLEPYSSDNITNAYFYARSIAFLGQTQTAIKLLQSAADQWPLDPTARLCRYQYGNLCLRMGEYKKAEDAFEKLRQNTPTQGMDDATEKFIHALRAQSKITEAIKTINPYCNAKSKKNRHQAIFLRGRTYFQGGRYREAYTDFDTLLKASTVPGRENLFWKALALEKMKQPQEASSLYDQLSHGNDFYALLAINKYRDLNKRDPVGLKENGNFQIGTLPGPESLTQVQDLYSKDDVIPSLLYLKLYDEAANDLKSISDDTWALMNVNIKDRQQKYLTLAYLAGLGENFGTATYYSELFIKSVPDRNAIYSAPETVRRALFPMPYYEPVYRFSIQRNLDPFLVLAIMRQESKFKRFARSPAFARGLMQLIPSTATRIASDLGLKGFSVEHLYSPEVNINLGTRYIQEIIQRFGRQLEIIAAGYNSGESNVRRWLDCTTTNEAFEFFSNIDLAETKSYVMIVRGNYESYKRTYQKENLAAMVKRYELAKK
ncbi:transglycosylase SLT domain-containing protein [bacterium]|nr:transglycosylase SLT domain-containing protein [bacterium]